MQKYFNTVDTISGPVVSGVSVLVGSYPGGSTASLFADAAGTIPLSNPVFTDSTGYFEFYAASGHYILTLSGHGIGTRVINDILLEDPTINLAVGGSTPAPGTVLDIQGTTGALKLPSLTTAQKNALVNVGGGILWDNTLGTAQINDGTGWASIAPNWASPGAIGSITPNTGVFTTLRANGAAATPAISVGGAAFVGWNNANWQVIDYGNYGAVAGSLSTSSLFVLSNAYSDGTTKYKVSGFAHILALSLTSGASTLSAYASGISGGTLGVPTSQLAVNQTTIASNINGTTVTSVSSTGLAVTGTFSASGVVTAQGNAGAGGFVAATSAFSAGSVNYYGTDNSGNSYINTPTTKSGYLNVNNTPVVQWSSTGLAVTGALSATGTLNGLLSLTGTTGWSGTGIASTGGNYAFAVNDSASSTFGACSSYAMVISAAATRNIEFNIGVNNKVATLDTSGNLGLGVTPSAWFGASGANGKTLQGDSWGIASTTGLDTTVYVNNARATAYGSAGSAFWVYRASSGAASYAQTAGIHSWLTAPSGTAGNAITWTQAMTLDASGNLGIGVTPADLTNNFKSFWLNGTVQYANGPNNLSIGTNIKGPVDAGGEAGTYNVSAASTRYKQSSGIHYWFTAASGTAGNAITWTQAMTLDNSGNLGLGVTPSAWGSGYSAIQLNGGAIDSPNSTIFDVRCNSFYNGTQEIYRTAGFATLYRSTLGIHQWFNAPSGTAGTAITFTQAMTLDASGNLGVGVTPSAWVGGFKALEFSGGASFSATGNGPYMIANATYIGAGVWTYKTTNPSSQYYQAGGVHIWLSAPSGTAGTTATYTQAMLLDASGNLGLNSTPSTLTNNWRQITLQGVTFNSNGINNLIIATNTTGDVGGTLNYGSTNPSAYYQQTVGLHRWYNAPSGTAGNPITWTQAMTLDASGNLQLGITTNPGSFYRQVISGDFGVHTTNDTAGVTQIKMGVSTSMPQGIASIVATKTAVGAGTLAFGTAVGGTLTTQMTLDASGNLGLGVTPSAWSNYKAIETVGGSLNTVSSGIINVTQNAYNNGTNWIYKTTAPASIANQTAGQHILYTAPSGTAGNAITFTQQLSLSSTALTVTPNIVGNTATATVGTDTTALASTAFVHQEAPQLFAQLQVTGLPGVGSIGLAASIPRIDFRNNTPAGTRITVFNPSIAFFPSIDNSTYGAPIVAGTYNVRLTILALYNAGTVTGGLVNGLLVDEGTLVNTTISSPSNNSAGVIYSQSALTNVPFRILGYVDLTYQFPGAPPWQAVVAVIPAGITGFGLGVSQDWSVVTGSRSLNPATPFWNGTGRPIEVVASVTCSAAGVNAATAIVNGVTIASCAIGTAAAAFQNTLRFTVPSGRSYQVNTTAASVLNLWSELR
jgi:hypothetical protein